MMREFIQKYKNAREAIKQIRAGEWVVEPFEGDHCYDATRGNLRLWLANGARFCEIQTRKIQFKQRPMYFGLFWRHYVWWAAARKLAATANKTAKPKTPVLT